METGITDAPKHVLPETAPDSKRKPAHPVYQALVMLADLRITVFLFALSMCIVFWGTLAQVDTGVWTVVKLYFRSGIVWIPLKVLMFNCVEDTATQIPFPGGWLIGGAMFVNLLAAHAVRFKLAWNRAGIIVIHLGIIVLMAGEVITGVYAIEGQMPIKEGQTTNQVTQGGEPEFVVIRRINDQEDDIVTVPQALLQTNSEVDDERLPFKIYVLNFMSNSDIIGLDHGVRNLANKGLGLRMQAKKLNPVAGVDPEQRHDAASAYVTLTGRDGKDLGTWLVSAHLDAQWMEVDGKKMKIALRFKQTTRPYYLHLTKFSHKVFPGTTKPRDFRSYVKIVEEDGHEREVEIYMNSPLYYRGETFYQSSWTTDPFTRKADGTVLQVVRNPGWLLPYLSCLLVGVGMLVHFGYTLRKFLAKRRTV